MALVKRRKMVTYYRSIKTQIAQGRYTRPCQKLPFLEAIGMSYGLSFRQYAWKRRLSEPS
jgi:hypothetical protein